MPSIQLNDSAEITFSSDGEDDEEGGNTKINPSDLFMEEEQQINLSIKSKPKLSVSDPNLNNSQL